LNEFDTPQQGLGNRVRYQRRFESLETRRVLSAEGLCAELEGDPDRPLDAEVAAASFAEHVNVLSDIGDATGIWDDTDIVHIDGGQEHDVALKDLDFAADFDRASLALLEELVNGDFVREGSGSNSFFDVFTEFTSAESFFDVWTDLQSGDQGSSSNSFFDVWTELSSDHGGSANGFEEVKVSIGEQSNGVIFVKIPSLTTDASIIDVGDLPDGFADGASIIDVGDLPDGFADGASIIDVGDLPDGFADGASIIDVGDLPDGFADGASIIDVGDLPDGFADGASIIDVGDLPDGFADGASIIDVGDLPDGFADGASIIDVGDLPDGFVDAWDRSDARWT
jgi:hypothetical protein